jgi:hypothetical protein
MAPFVLLSVSVALVITSLLPQDLSAQRKDFGKKGEALANVEGLVWYGDDPHLTFEKIAALCAPILWFSPDEPLLEGKRYGEIRIPQPFPFEEPVDTPVVYYRIRRIVISAHAEWYDPEIDRDDPGSTMLDISKLAGLDLDFFLYYPTEEGFGGHDHDVEAVEMRVLFGSKGDIQEGV